MIDHSQDPEVSGITAVQATATALEPRDLRRPEGATLATEATRYLCAAVHLDRGIKGRPGTQLRQQISEHIEDNTVRALGVSPGVDLRPVVAQYGHACRRKLWRDVVLSVLLIALMLAPISSAPVVLAACVFLLACEVVHVEAWYATYRVVARRMLPGRFDPDREMQTSDRRMLARMREIDEAQSGNVTAYSGFTPFVGVGGECVAWSFPINVAHGRESIGGVVEPKPFTVSTLYEHLTTRLEALAIPGLEIEDRLYADGRRLRDDPRLLPDPFGRPSTRIDPADLHESIGAEGETARHYKVVHVVAWGGELVLSMHFRVLRADRGLFVEVSNYLLAPLYDGCHAVDRIHPTPDWRDNLRLLRDSVAATPLLWVKAPGAVLRAATGPVRRWRTARRIRRQLRADPLFDRGAMESVRHLQRAGAYRQYFQKLDWELDAIVDFLDEHDIDTSELKQRGATVLNNGVMVTGGSFTAGSVAAGSKSRATFKRMSAGGKKA
jgi:hypothetical protein